MKGYKRGVQIIIVKSRSKLPLPFLYPAASNIFSMNIPYPRVGSFTKTCVTAPTNFPFCTIGDPDTGDCHYGQQFLGVKTAMPFECMAACIFLLNSTGRI
jgi:hypothetical protein